MSAPKSILDEITTCWVAVRDPNAFVLRYATAVRAYLIAILGDVDAAEEVAQDFYAAGLRRGFARTEAVRGRFRDYLKAAVRNAARTRGRRRADAAALAEDPAVLDPGDAEWLAQWRRTAMDRAWLELDRHQRQTAGSLAHTVLRLAVDHPEEDSEALAARASLAAGRPVRADAFRKQLSRARQRFAEALVAEVAETLADPSPERVEEELAEVGLLAVAREYLGPDFLGRR